MIKIVTNNLGVKILALLLALGLWVFVAASTNNIVQFPGSIPIKAINTPGGNVAIYDTKEVSVKIVADSAVWKQLTSDNFSAFVDLNGLSAGIHDVKVIANANLPNIQIVDIAPANIMVRIEPVVNKTVNINAIYTGQVADGRTVGGADFTPDQVNISGPKSLVELITTATAEIKLSGQSADFAQDITLKVLNDKNEKISDVTINPSSAKAAVKIVKAGNNKTVGVKVTTSGFPASGYFVSNITADPATVDIIGQDSILSQTQFIETQPIDLSNQSDTLIKTVSLTLPSGLSLQKDSSQRVKVTISFAASQVTKELTAVITPVNLTPGLKANSLNPSSIKVIVSGPANTLNNLSSADVILNLDLVNKSTGTFGVDLSSAMFKVPEGVTVTSFLPSSISVNITNQ